MGTFDAKYAAYETAMQNHGYFGLKGGEQIAEQFGRYAVGLQYDEVKAAKKAEGREYARMLAEERKALSAAEQINLSEGLSGTGNVTEPAVTNPKKVNEGVKIEKKNESRFCKNRI